MIIKEELSAKNKIMVTALKMFADKGIDGVSVREISKKSGQNISQISYYFKSKEGLYKTIIKEHALVVSQQIKQIVQSLNHDGLSKNEFEREMRQFVSIFVTLRIENPHFAKIMQRETLEGMPFAKEVHNETMKPLSMMMESFMDKAKKNKIVKKETPVNVFFILLTESIWGFMAKRDCDWNLMGKTFNFPKDKELFIECVYQIFFKGILK